MTEGMMMMKLMKTLPLAGVVCCAMATTGCSSVMSHTGASQGYYPGTRASADMLSDG
ncbi:YceK/YidQ family lipoprotein, partial [Pantoea agglomerans]|nr:YceK/YidQ family lipoprotein [Pantoea agglomerans]